jgi:phosphotransferase system enzyme I (PtsI)
MIEIPSAAITADILACEADFFSIGTNDLIQYSLAIDRVNEHVSYLYEPLHPANLRNIKGVVDIAHQEGIEVGICGEMAADPLYTLIFLGLGLDELSMHPLAIPRVKKVLRRSTHTDGVHLLKQVLQFATAKETELFIRKEMCDRFPEDFIQCME